MNRLLFLSVWILLGATACTSRDKYIWQGNLYRLSDNRKLSEVCLKITKDSLYIYSNAIFGNENRRLAIRHKKKNDYVCHSESETIFPMTLEYSTNRLVVFGTDYRMELSPSKERDFTPEQLQFYKYRDVSPKAEHYFEGRYTGFVIRKRDRTILSPVCAEFTGDTLQIYANAIFGKAHEKLYYQGVSRTRFFYVSQTGESFYFSPSADKEYILLNGDDFFLMLHPLHGDWNMACAFYKGQYVSRRANDYTSNLFLVKKHRYKSEDEMNLHICRYMSHGRLPFKRWMI